MTLRRRKNKFGKKIILLPKFDKVDGMIGPSYVLSILYALSFELAAGILGHKVFNASYKYSVPSNLPDQSLFPLPYAGSARFLYRITGERTDLEENRPLCEEERKSLNVWELIRSEKTSAFLQPIDYFELNKYNFIPRKVDVIKCVPPLSSNEEKSLCKPENCRERKVDVEVFGRLKNETFNTWKFMGTLSGVPVACECFIRWKPEKCSRPIDIFTVF